MAQEASVAPKERVNIVYKPATGDAKEEVELPLKLLVLGDFTNRPDDRTMEDRDPISVDKDNFDDVLKAGQEKAVKEAVAAKEAEMVAQIKAKGNAAVLGNPGGQPPAGGVNWDERLKNADKYGGRNAVIAEKLAAQRRAAGR